MKSIARAAQATLMIACAARAIRLTQKEPAMRGRVLDHHLVWTGYGNWLPNDPRGSGSSAIAKDELRSLGAVHFGRKSTQPRSSEVKAYYERANDLLEHPRIKFNEEMISVIAAAFAATIQKRHDTCYDCAILPDHCHLVIRAHRDDGDAMIAELQKACRLALFEYDFLPEDHPVWIDGGWKVYLGTPEAIRGTIRYAEDNPRKEGMPAQHWPFVTTYDGRPFPRRSTSRRSAKRKRS